MAILVENFSGQPYEGKGQTIKIDYAGRTDGQPVYVGFAPPGGDTDDAIWKIMFLEYDGFPTGNLISRTWADGEDGKAEFNQVWDNRASLVYS